MRRDSRHAETLVCPSCGSAEIAYERDAVLRADAEAIRDGVRLLAGSFGIEIDADQVTAGAYESIRGDVQSAYPLLRLVRTQFPRVTCNPPFGLDWRSTAARRTRWMRPGTW